MHTKSSADRRSAGRFVMWCLAAMAVLIAGRTALQSQSPAQSPQLPIQSRVDLVLVDVLVIDKNRVPVRGLTAADFTLLEDGVERPIGAFTPVTLSGGGSSARPASVPPATAAPSTALGNDEGSREGRIVVVLFDRTIAIDEMPYARRAAEQLVDELGPNDLAMVMHTGVPESQSFSADRQELLAAIAQPYRGAHRIETAMCSCDCTLEAMTAVAEKVAVLAARRKMLVYLGSKIEVGGSGSCVRQARERLFRATDAANLTIYTLDSRGLEILAPNAQQRRAPDLDGADLVGTHLVRQGSLSIYAERTGGRAVLNTNLPEDSLSSIFRESAEYYVVGFTPGAPADGRRHAIEVQVNKRGTLVRARRAYDAPAR